jgi:transcriptional regulator with XRE-family HTH domain
MKQEKSTPAVPALHVGSTLRKLRSHGGLRLEDLARRAGFTKGFLSKIENGRATPPIATLMRLAQALAVDPAIFFKAADSNGTSDPNRSVHTSPRGRLKVANASAGPGYSYWALASQRPHKAMEPFLLTVYPQKVDRKKRFEHPGEEFIFVLKGRTEYVVGDETFVLGPGDSLYFDATRPHAPLPKDGPVTFLAMFCAPPRPVNASAKGKASHRNS